MRLSGRPAPARAEPIKPLLAAFVLLAALAWMASPGIAVALACYGALLVSEQIHLQCRARPSARAEVLGIGGVWLSVLAFGALVLPSNFGAVIS